MTEITTSAPTPSTDRYRPSAALLVGAPLLMAVGRALLVPMDDEDWSSTLTAMGGHEARSTAGWFLAFVACALLGLSAVTLARPMAAAGQRRAAGFVTVAVTVGWSATAVTCGYGLYLTAAAAAGGIEPLAGLQVEVEESTGTGLLFVATAVAAIAYIVLAVGLVRASAASRGAAVLVAIGGFTTLLTMAGPWTAVLVVTSLLLAAGHALVSSGAPEAVSSNGPA